MTFTTPTPSPSDSEIQALRQRLSEAQARNAALESQLRETEQHWRFILENGPDIVFLVDEQLRIQFINRVPAGLEPDDVLATPVLDYVAAEHRAEVGHKIRRVMDTGEAETFEIAARGPEDSVACYSTYLGPVRRNGRIDGVMLVTRDITPLKQAEAAARERELELTAVTDNLPVLIAYVDTGERYRFNSRGYQAWFGLEPQAIQGMHLQDVLGKTGYSEIAPYVRQALSGVQASFESTIHYARGGTRHVAATYVPDTDSTGAVKGFVAVIADITERKDAEEAARLHREELTHAARVNLAGEMVSALAHELTQPLTAMEHYAEAIAAAMPQATPQAVAEAVRDMGDQVQRAGNIIRQLREFVRKRQASKHPVDLNHTVAESVHLVTPSARRKNIHIAVDLSGAPLKVLADNIQIEQVLVNLIHNSIEAIDQCASSVRRIDVHTRRVDGKAQVTIRDTGPGIDPERSDRVFEVFESTKSEGMGMGLSISRSIVKAHGGGLWYEPAPGGGAAFRFSLPLEEDPL